MAFIIILGVICAVLMVLSTDLNNKNAKLAVENDALKGRLEGLQEAYAQQIPVADESLTAEGIAEVVRDAGFKPEVYENLIEFMYQGEETYIDTARLPLVFVSRQYNVNPNEWEMKILKHAAHVMADELIMVKAIFYDDLDKNGETGLRLFVASMDRNYSSFRANLLGYIHLIEDGRRYMNDIYEKIVKKKREAALTAKPFEPGKAKDNKIAS